MSDGFPLRRALVTGASGMLGSYLVQCLAADRCGVRALVRDANRAAWLEPLGAELVAGDVRDPGALREASTGCDVVFHAAARVGPDTAWTPFRDANVFGTQRVIDACAAVGARLLHVSSTAVYGAQRYEMAPVDESTPLPALPAHDAYGRSKQEAERLVLAAHERGMVQCAVVRPPPMYGERDRHFVPRVGAVLSRGVFPLIGGGTTTLPLVHARNVAEGAVLAATTSGAQGRVYNLTADFPITVADLVRLASQGLGRRVFTPRIPRAVGRAMFHVLEVALLAAGRRGVSRRSGGTFDLLTNDNPFREARARRELGWQPSVAPGDGIPAAFRWWADHPSGDSAFG
ncbi:MAG TPA: NAD-dependent epimerase/dehydratase family protein [Gemmatimonadaceae bacterium]|nr:NAD-dependent epimerase/dehydratase family protein [Gemmatimonadaceae bacterium]